MSETANSRITVPDLSSGGKFYAVRTADGNLVETGWLDPDGVKMPDTEMTSDKPFIDGSNPAAMVPWDQKWV